MAPRAPPTRRRPAQGGPGVLSPVLLLGGGLGEATCGILYLAGFLRRHGVEAFVRVHDGDESEAEVVRSLTALLERVRPRVVGISLKWYHHVHRALLLARAVRAIDPQVRVVLGGNSASFWWQELLGFDCVDDVVLGDGEVPLLSLCRGEPAPPNCARRGADGAPRRAPFGYVQSAASADVFYSHFDQLFLSELDLASFSGWVAPGKGCGENCLYCGGGRGSQKAAFGRADPFVRPLASVRRDHRELAPKVWQFRYDFSGGTAAFMGRVWKGFDFSRHSTTYFLWGVPPRALIDALGRTFGRAYMVLDIGCFSQTQREELMRRGVLKPCASDAELLEAVHACRAHHNLKLEVSGIAGLPFTSAGALEEEERLVEQLLSLGCDVGYQRLEAQPGALVTHHPERFGMETEARTFGEFLSWFSARAATDPAVPMVRFLDAAVERAVERTCVRLQAAAQRQAATAGMVAVHGRTRLTSAGTSTRTLPLGDWFGQHRVPARAAGEAVTVVRALDGAGLACAPALSPRAFADPMLHQGAAGAAILSVLDAFARPTTVAAALAQLRGAGLGAEAAREVVEQLAAGRFLRPS